MNDAYTIRPFDSIDDYHACVDLQEETWGRGFSERVSPAILQVAQILGGVSAGAFDADGRLVGFVFGLTGLRDGETVHWSDMLAVRPEARDGGLGRRLKAYQRQEVLDRGVTRMYWTFDPLQSRNAYLNLRKLGVVVREYRENMYGETDSPLHRGIGTDRFVALWLLDSSRVRRRLRALGVLEEDDGPPSEADDDPVGTEEAPFALRASEDRDPHPRPGTPDPEPGNDVVRVAIPSNIGAVMQDDLELAVAWRVATRAVFQHLLSHGYQVSDFQRGDEVSAYVVSRIPHEDR